MLKSTRIILAIFVLLIFTGSFYPLAERNLEDIAPEGFRPIYTDEDGKKIIYESEDEDDDTEIGIDYSVDLGEDEGDFVDFGEVEGDDSFIEVLGDLSLDEAEDKPRSLILPVLALGLPLAGAGIYLILKRNHG